MNTTIATTESEQKTQLCCEVNEAPEAVIEIEKVCFRYERQEVLHNINLRIRQGNFVILVGPNGGGKTTLLRLILGLLEPLFGNIRVLGGSPAQARRRIGYVPQSLQFDAAFPASVLDIVLMGRVERHRFGPYSREDRAVAQDCLWQVGLGEYGKRAFASLSGGERQRVLIAQALACQPELLLLDEPNANLDAVGSQTIYELLRELNKRLTIVLVSHNLNTVESYASHIVCVNHTAEMHCLGEVSSSADGHWTHLRHAASCPVSLNANSQACCQENHLGKPSAEDGKTIF
ncbi:MAG: ABC transporter ATP-binding protein [Lentisphaeria bacterium]|nr:ABC transporter ATP-binding protein [Lentisphaeria bacterium]